MNKAIEKYFSLGIISKKKLSGGVSFETYLLELSNHEKVVFRAGSDYLSSLNDKIYIEDIFKREQMFYDVLREYVPVEFPKIRVIDSSGKYYHKTFEIYDYIEGVPLHQAAITACAREMVDYDIGKIVGKIHKYKISEGQREFLRDEEWNVFFAKRLKSRLTPLTPNGLILPEEISYIEGLCQKIMPSVIRDSFLHLDIRPNNFLYTDKISALIDAENFEIGDCLFELARIEAYGLLNDSFIAGYTSEYPEIVLDKEDMIYKIYKLETISFLLNVFLNDLKIMDEHTKQLGAEFYEIKRLILKEFFSE